MLWYSKKALIGLLSVLVLVCALIEYKENLAGVWPVVLCQKGKRSSMLDYMKDKYGEEFIDEEAYGGQMGKDYAMRKVHSINQPKESILVRAMGKEEVIFQDNYLACLLRDEIETRMGGLAEKFFGECKVYYKIPELVFPAEFPADMEVDAFLRHPLSMVRLYIYVKNCPSDKEAQVDVFLSALSEAHYIIGGVVSYPKGEEMYEMITADNFAGDIYQGYQRLEEAIFSMDREGKISYLRWI